MAAYRVYCLNDEGQITSGDWLEADSDQQAIEKVKAQKHSVRCDVWQGQRRVAEVPPHSGL